MARRPQAEQKPTTLAEIAAAGEDDSYATNQAENEVAALNAQKPEDAERNSEPQEPEGPSREEFVAYVNEELQPIAEKFGLVISVKEKNPAPLDKKRWPAAHYDQNIKAAEKRVAAARVFNSPDEVPGPNWTRDINVA